MRLGRATCHTVWVGYHVVKAYSLLWVGYHMVKAYSLLWVVGYLGLRGTGRERTCRTSTVVINGCLYCHMQTVVMAAEVWGDDDVTLVEAAETTTVEIKLFGKWSSDEVTVNDISLTVSPSHTLPCLFPCFPHCPLSTHTHTHTHTHTRCTSTHTHRECNT